MKKLYIITALGLLLTVTSCNGLYQLRSARSLSLTPDDVKLSLSMADFELLGETEITTFSREYFGFINKLDSVNSVEYERRAVTRVALRGEKDIRLPRAMKKALYKAVDAYPDADYFMPVYVQTDEQKMFMGKYIWRKAIIKAYKFR